jgi:ankyrin repeat protein
VLREDVQLKRGESRETELILAKHLIEHGANVNTLSAAQGQIALHKAYYRWVNVTNPDFVELLLKEGADPNFLGPI